MTTMHTPTPYCRHCKRICPKVLGQSWEKWRWMRYCDDQCREAADEPIRLTRDELLSEIDALISTDTPQRIAQRLNQKPTSIARRLHRYGMHELACAFERAA